MLSSSSSSSSSSPVAPAATPVPPALDFPIEVARRVLAEARRALGMEVAFFAELTPTHLVVRALDGNHADFGVSEGHAMPIEDTFCARMVTGELNCWVPDTAADPVTRSLPATREIGIGSYVGVPVHHADGTVFGTVCCVSRERRPDLDERDARLLRALAGVIASQLEHEHRYHQVLEDAHEPVWITDLHGRTVFANEPLARLLGVPRETLAGRSALDFLPDGAERSQVAFTGLRSDRLERSELELLRADGRRLPVEASSAPLTDDDGNVIGTVATLTDLTERREAEAASEERFRWLANLVPQQIWIADQDGRIDFLNERVAEYYGREARIEHTLDWTAFLHPDDLPVMETIRARRAAGLPYTFTGRLRRHDGEYRMHLAHAVPIHDAGGAVRRWCGVMTDLTEARAQERLHESEAKLRDAQRIARLGSFEWDAGRGTLHGSEELMRLLELEGVSIDGQIEACAERLHPEDRPRVVAAANRALATGEPFQLDVRLVLPSGTPRTVHARVQLTADLEGLPASMAGTVLDITEQRAAEHEARGRLEAERANLAKSDFLSRMSHELRTPLNAILGFGQLLETESLTEDQHDSVGHVLKAGAHLLQLINEVLEISRIEAGVLRLSLEPVGLRELVREVVDLVAPLAAERGIEVSVDPSPKGDEFVHADLQRTNQILLNLLSNAIKYNRDGGRVTVRIRPGAAGHTRIVVSDTGLGLRPDQLERAFSPFERLHADGDTEGTGLGLALSRSLAEAMGGELTAASQPGHGSDFSLQLERTEAPMALVAAEPSGSAAPVAVAAAADSERVRVLCVEDNPSNLRLVERVLDRAGFEVIGASRGLTGMELARRHIPDLVLLDLDLPDVSGETVLETLVADPVTAGIPVLICSADATRSTIDRMHSSGARGYLTKPLDVNGLLKAVARLTDGDSGT